MNLDTVNKRIQIKLLVAITTNQSSVVCTWVDMEPSGPVPGCTVALTNSTTQVDVVAPPGSNTQRVVKEIIVHNLDTVSSVFIVSYKDGGTVTEIHRFALLPNQTITYNDKIGWLLAPSLADPSLALFAGPTVPRTYTFIDADGKILQENSQVGTDNQLVFEGDSLTFGSGGSHPYSDDVSPAYPFTKTNLGVGGQTMNTIRLNGRTRDFRHVPQAGRNIIVLWAGTNDVAFNTFGNAQTLLNMQSYCNSRRRAGWKVIVGTMISRGDTSPTDNNKNALNNEIRYYWPDFADGLADFAADTRIGADGAWASSTYFNTDKVHLKDAGYAIVAAIATKAIDVLACQVGGWKSSFRATKNGTNQTGIATGTWTKLTFGTAVFNVGEFYNPSVSQWYPPIGPMRLRAQVNINAGLVVGSTAFLALYKNGAGFALTPQYVDTTSFRWLEVVATDIAVSGDVWEVYVWCDGTGNKTVDGTATLTFVHGESL